MSKREVYQVRRSIANLVLVDVQYIVSCSKFCNLVFTSERRTCAPLLVVAYSSGCIILGGKGMDSVV